VTTGTMTDTFSPPVWRRRVANELRRLRETAGLSHRDAAQHLGCRVPKISLMESGQRNVNVDDLTKLLEFYKVSEVDHDDYITAAKRSRGKAWWELYEEAVVPDFFKEYLAIEQGAHRMRAFTPILFHGLLQCRDYTTAVLRQHPSRHGEEVVRRKVAVRQQRKAAITRTDNPLQFTCLTDESTLHRMVGGRAVMADQLRHVATLIRERPNITVQIVPHNRGVAFYDCAIFSFSWPNDPGVIWMEHFAGGEFLDSLDEIDAHTLAFQRLQEAALSTEESLELIEQSATDYST
jgi:transcriptional regulator with XRE-family HTH domain